MKIFGGNHVGKCEGRTFGWVRQDYVHDWYGRTNEKLDSHITENLTSLSVFGSIFENFWEPMLVNVRVILLVGYDKTMYTRINEKIDSHITEI